MIPLIPGDVDYGWRTVFQEAAGESFEGKKAVAHVIRNRVEFAAKDRWCTIAQACLDWRQFSGWREDDPTFMRAMNATLNTPGAMECVHAFIEAMREADFTKGARHYHAKSIMPPWAVGHTPCVVIGNHWFYNDVK